MRASASNADSILFPLKPSAFVLGNGPLQPCECARLGNESSDAATPPPFRAAQALLPQHWNVLCYGNTLLCFPLHFIVHTRYLEEKVGARSQDMQNIKSDFLSYILCVLVAFTCAQRRKRGSYRRHTVASKSGKSNPPSHCAFMNCRHRKAAYLCFR